MYKDNTDLVVAILPLIFIVLLLIILGIGGSISDDKHWNNGYCDCGGKWVYQQAVGHQYSTGYMYKCDVCGKYYEFDTMR